MGRARDPSRPQPAYVEVLRALRQQARGQAPGAALPSERDLAARFGVGRMTVRAAVRILRQEGVLVVHRGAGAFVAVPPAEVPHHAAADARAAGPLEARVLRFERTAAEAAAADALGLPIGAPVFRIERLLLSGAAVVGHERTSVAVSTCPALFRYNLEHASVPALLAREGVPIVSAIEEVRAAAAGRTFAALSRGRPSDPVLVVRRTGFGSRRQPLAWSVTVYRADRFKATFELPASPPTPPPD